MISAVSGISFKGETINAQDLINSPGQFTTVPQQQEIPVDSFEKAGEEKKKSNTGLKVAIGVAVAALAAFIGLGYAVHNGHLERVDIPADGFLKKIGARIKNAGVKVGEWAESCYKSIMKLFGKEVKDTKVKPDATDAK
ncbi:hypothetical protein J6P92_08465 [bacterium]|nr:hypothetical protein [bacterium]